MNTPESRELQLERMGAIAQRLAYGQGSATIDYPYSRPILSQHEQARALIVRSRLDSRLALAQRS